MRYIFILTVLFCAFQLHAQVLVHQEPRHHPVFENGKIRILDVHLPPGDTTQYHLHHTPSLFLFFSNTKIVTQLQGSEPTEGSTTAGKMLYENLASPHTRIHRVWDIDTSELHVMDIELLSKDSGFSQRRLNGPNLQLVIDTGWARVYKITLESQKSISLKNKNRSFVLVELNSGNAQYQVAHNTASAASTPGTYFLIRPGETFSLKNYGSNKMDFALLELP